MNLQELWDKVLARANELAKESVNHADQIPGQPSGVPVREDEAIDWLTERLDDEFESKDQYIPVIGKYMDLPPVDLAQKAAIRYIVQLFVRRAFAELQIKRLASGTA